MNVREALEKGMGDHIGPNCHAEHWLLDQLAPKVEAALRAAYQQGYRDSDNDIYNAPRSSNRGVTAGVEKLGK